MKLLTVKLFVQKEQSQRKKWLYISIYRPPQTNNLDSFFEELNTFLSIACCKYENFVILGDFNPKRAREGHYPPPPCGFSKNVCSKERLKPI